MHEPRAAAREGRRLPQGGAKLGCRQFKEISGVSRRVLRPLLEYFDRSGLTIRVGDQRVLRMSAGG